MFKKKVNGFFSGSLLTSTMTKSSFFSLSNLFLKINIIRFKRSNTLFIFRNYYSFFFFFNMINSIDRLFIQDVNFFLINSRILTKEFFFNVFSEFIVDDDGAGYFNFINKRALWSCFIINLNTFLNNILFKTITLLKWHQFIKHH